MRDEELRMAGKKSFKSINLRKYKENALEKLLDFLTKPPQLSASNSQGLKLSLNVIESFKR